DYSTHLEVAGSDQSPPRDVHLWTATGHRGRRACVAGPAFAAGADRQQTRGGAVLAESPGRMAKQPRGFGGGGLEAPRAAVRGGRERFDARIRSGDDHGGVVQPAAEAESAVA